MLPNKARLYDIFMVRAANIKKTMKFDSERIGINYFCFGSANVVWKLISVN